MCISHLPLLFPIYVLCACDMFMAMGTNAHAYKETRGRHQMSFSVTFHSILLRKGTYLAELKARLAASKPTVLLSPPTTVLVLEVPVLIPSFVCTGSLCLCSRGPLPTEPSPQLLFVPLLFPTLLLLFITANFTG